MTPKEKIKRLKLALCEGCRNGWVKVKFGVHHDPRPDGYRNEVYYERCAVDMAFSDPLDGFTPNLQR